MEIKWVKVFKETSPEFFHQFSISVSPAHTLLIAEFLEGKKWLVVAFLSDNETTKNFPKWVQKNETN